MPTTSRQMPVLAQSQGSGGGTGYTLGCDSQGSVCEDATLNTIPYYPSASHDATASTAAQFYSGPNGWTTGAGVNLAPLFGSNFSQYNPMRAGLQTLGVGIGGAVIAAGGVALAPALKGPALGALMELSGSSVNTYAAQNVLTVIETEGYAEFLEGVNALGEALKSLEEVEVTGPEILW